MVTSNDKAIQESMRGQNWATAYFAVGDPFVCGSWIPESALNEIAEKVAAEKTDTDAKGSLKKGQKWATAGITLLGGGLGAGITDVLQTKTGLGGLLNTTGTKNRTTQTAINNCARQVKSEVSTLRGVLNSISAGGHQCLKQTCSLRTTGEIRGPGTTKYNKNNGNYDYDDAEAIDSKTVVCYSTASETNTCDALVSEITTYLDELDDAEYKVCGVDNSYNQRGQSGRAVADVVGGVLVGGLTGITTWQSMKAANRAKFTEAQQEFMDNVGSKINCVIGNDGYDLSTLGSFGDMMISELDTSSSGTTTTTPTTATNTAITNVATTVSGTVSTLFR